jgi:hypothetical protein
MQIERISRDAPAADLFVKEALATRIMDFPAARRQLAGRQYADPDRRLMDAAAALKTYHPAYVRFDELAEEVARAAEARFPGGAEGAIRRARHLFNAG